MRAPSPEVPFIYLRLLCSILTDRGYDCSGWLKRAEIGPARLLQPDVMVTLSQVERFLAAVEMGTGCSDWGFWLGKSLKLTSHGAMGFMLINCDTLGEVFTLGARYYRMTNPLYVLKLAEYDKIVTGTFSRAYVLPERTRRFYDEAIAVSVYEQMLPFFKDRTPRVWEFRLGIAAPPHLAAYAELRGARFVFGDVDSDGVTFHLDRGCLGMKNEMADAHSRAIAEEICHRRCQQLDQEQGWADWVARALRAAEGTRPSQGDLAALLYMSPRTLERALAREGSSFKDIYEQVGFERARELLDERRHSISSIAERLGYSGIGAFSRAFKRRCGVTPSEYLAREEKSRGRERARH